MVQIMKSIIAFAFSCFLPMKLFAMNGDETIKFVVSVESGQFFATCESTGNNFAVIEAYLNNLTLVARARNFVGNIGDCEIEAKRIFVRQDVIDLYDKILATCTK